MLLDEFIYLILAFNSGFTRRDTHTGIFRLPRVLRLSRNLIRRDPPSEDAVTGVLRDVIVQVGLGGALIIL